ncbi:MFS transporter [Actinophytocola oryzae]|uniref:Putative MFS family arabinose efflux permease n=1 Tax=Actinophytocola oryzae TaxID=502181 RepID=A0A4R7W087_9PSEU|nr:MFS transporter [Actinophytocola oryzae]TDV54937.1 putative MFS family arabinose efflux permease [Actinophytocola oryzae]
MYLLRAPYFLWLLTSNWLGRLPSAMSFIAVPLALREVGAGFGFIGVATGTVAIAAAVGAPLLGRLVDRVGQVRVLVPCSIVAAVGFGAVAVAPRVDVVVIVGAVLAGAATPPLEPCLRVLWPDIVGKDRLERAYAIDSAAQEMVFICGPLVVAACVALVSPVFALWTAAVLGVLGVVIFAVASPVRAWRPEPRVPDWLGPLRSTGLAVLLGGLAGAGFAIGVLTVLVVSYAERHHVTGGAPMLLALNAGGALVGALTYGAVKWRTATRRRAVGAAAGLAVGYALLSIVPSPPYMALLMVITGLFLAPLLTATFVLIGELAPRGTTTEAFAWLITLFAFGNSAGSAVVGVVIDGAGLHWAAACSVLGTGWCLVALLGGYRLLTPVASGR